MRRLLADRGINRRQLATAIGVHYNHLSSVVTGRVPASEQLMAALAEHCGVTVEELLGIDTALERRITALVDEAPPLPPDAIGRIVQVLARPPTRRGYDSPTVGASGDAA